MSRVFYFSDAFLAYRKKCELGISYGLLGVPKDMTNFDLDELAPSKSELFANEDTIDSKNFEACDQVKISEETQVIEPDKLEKSVHDNFAKFETDVFGLKTCQAEESGSVHNLNEFYLKKRTPKSVKLFEKVESAGTEVSFRCPGCRVCQECIKSPRIECISIKEEAEQFIIDKSVTIDLEKKFVSVYLPFLCDPTKKLSSNFHIAEKIYFSQARKLSSKPEKDKNDVISGFKKLSDLNYITKLSDLSNDAQELINSSQVKYYIPWTAVWNANSVSTPCRPVFNASCASDTGYSLNDLLPKGRNSLNKLVQIFIRWRMHAFGFHTDIQKMYNSINLDPRHWCYQLCLFHEKLDPGVRPNVYVIKTLIYGVRTSGNQAERALRETARLSKDKYPRQNNIVQNDIYMDDCFSGDRSYEDTVNVTDGLHGVLAKGGFRLKGITFSGSDPPDHLCNDDSAKYRKSTILGPSSRICYPH